MTAPPGAFVVSTNPHVPRPAESVRFRTWARAAWGVLADVPSMEDDYLGDDGPAFERCDWCGRWVDACNENPCRETDDEEYAR